MKKIILILSLFFASLANSDDFFNSELDSFSEISSGRSVNMDKTSSVVSVIDEEDIKNRGFKYVYEAIGSLPGVFVQKNTLAQSHSYVCRGINSKYNSEVLFMINNTPIKTLAYGNLLSGSWINMSTSYIDKIEVIRGNGSALYGADAFSCVINVSLKEELTDSVAVDFSNKQSAYFAKNLLSDDSDHALSAQFFIENNDYDGGKVNFDSQSSQDLINGTNFSNAGDTGNFEYKSFDYTINYSKGDFNLSYMSQNRYDFGLGYGLAQSIDPTGKYDSSRNLLNLDYSFGLINDVQSKLIFSHFNFTEKNEDLATIYPVGLKGSPELFETSSSLSLDNILEFDKHYLKFGGGITVGKIEDTSDYNNFTPDGSFVNVDGDDLNIYAPEKERINKFMYFQDEWNIFNETMFLFGVRYDDYNDFGETINPRMSLIIDSGINITNKFLYGRAFRAPTIVELFSVNNPIAQGNENLKPETIDTLEYVMHYNNNDDLTFTANLYYFVINNDIRFIDIEGSGGKKADNSGETNGYGSELELTYIISPFSKLESNFSYQKTYDVTNSERVKRYPYSMIKTTYFHDLNNTLSFSFNVNYYSKRHYMNKLDGQKINNTDPVFISTFNLISEIEYGEIALKVNNLFNVKKYDVHESSTSGLPDLSYNDSERYISISYKMDF